MQQTEKYQFNLIESSDPFSAQPLNDNMAKVEAALDAADAAVTAHRTEVNTALAAHRTEVNTALSAHQTEVNTALATHQTQVNAALSAQAADTSAQFAQQPKLHVLTWVGDGARTKTLTFPFQPKVVLLMPQVSDNLTSIAIEYGLAYGYRSAYGGFQFIDLTWNGNSVTMWDRNYTDSMGPFNCKDHPYVALAIG